MSYWGTGRGTALHSANESTANERRKERESEESEREKERENPLPVVFRSQHTPE